MSIGSTIKKLRRERDMTQEQLAEYLGITANAVSQWECDRTAPDISQLPMLAYVLDVSTDEILGVDIMKYDEEIKKIINSQFHYYEEGNFEECVKIIRNGLNSYPKSHLLMSKLAHVLECLGGHDEELEKLCFKVLSECTDNEIRNTVYQDLIYHYKNVGKPEEAIKYAKEMSHTWVSQEEMLMSILKGDSARKHMVEYIKFLSGRLSMCLSSLANDSAYSSDEKIALEKQSAAVIELIYPNGDYHYYAQHISNAYYSIAKISTENNNIDEALIALEKSVEFAIHFDTYNFEEVNTSPAARGFCDGGWIKSPDGNYCADKLLSIEKEKAFDPIRSDCRYKKIIADLKKYAK